MKKPPEMVPGDKNARLNFYLFLAVYILLMVSLESLMDFALLVGVDNRDPQSIMLMNQNKIVITNMVITLMQILPLLLIAWLGYRILTSAKVPPARMKLPFMVPLIKGKNARLIGSVLMTLSLLVIAYDLVSFIQKITL